MYGHLLLVKLLVPLGVLIRLMIEHGGEKFVASSRMGRVPVIDSLTFTFEEADSFLPDSYFAEFWATDPAGANDTYRIKTWKNGVLLNKPEELNLAYDAGFSAGGNFDGVAFITPIRSEESIHLRRMRTKRFFLLMFQETPYMWRFIQFLWRHSTS